MTDVEPARSFSWTAKNVGVTSIGEHRITPQVSGGATVNLSLHQHGPLAPLLAVLTSKLTRRYVEAEAHGLKRRCEA